MPDAAASFDLILFDLDGTLVETAPDIADAVNDALRQVNLPELSQQQISDWIGQGTLALLAQAVATSSARTLAQVHAGALLAQTVAEYNRCYAQRCGQRSRLYPQVRETLTHLRARGVKLAVVTNKERRHTDAVLARLGLQALFDAVVSGDSFAVKKPDPTGVRHCLTQFGVAPERTLFVGDSSIDAATARNAGVAVWLLPYGYNMGQPLAACAPDRIIADLSELQGG